MKMLRKYAKKFDVKFTFISFDVLGTIYVLSTACLQLFPSCTVPSQHNKNKLNAIFLSILILFLPYIPVPKDSASVADTESC